MFAEFITKLEEARTLAHLMTAEQIVDVLVAHRDVLIQAHPSITIRIIENLKRKLFQRNFDVAMDMVFGRPEVEVIEVFIIELG